MASKNQPIFFNNNDSHYVLMQNDPKNSMNKSYMKNDKSIDRRSTPRDQRRSIDRKSTPIDHGRLDSNNKMKRSSNQKIFDEDDYSKPAMRRGPTRDLYMNEYDPAMRRGSSRDSYNKNSMYFNPYQSQNYRPYDGSRVESLLRAVDNQKNPDFYPIDPQYEDRRNHNDSILNKFSSNNPNQDLRRSPNRRHNQFSDPIPVHSIERRNNRSPNYHNSHNNPMMKRNYNPKFERRNYESKNNFLI